MAYNIYKSDGTAISVPDNAISQQFYAPNANGAGKGIGSQLVGRNAVDYGAPIAQNFLQLTENFAGTIPPADGKALQGQLWFDKTSVALHVNVSTTVTADWRKVVTVSGSETGSTPVINPSGPANDGDLQIVGSVISIWADGAWQQVFPAVYS